MCVVNSASAHLASPRSDCPRPCHQLPYEVIPSQSRKGNPQAYPCLLNNALVFMSCLQSRLPGACITYHVGRGAKRAPRGHQMYGAIVVPLEVLGSLTGLGFNWL